MKIKYTKQISDDIICLSSLNEIISNKFKDVVKDHKSCTIYIGRSKYINLDYNDNISCSCYIDLGNTYMRYNRTLKELLYIVMNDPYIKRNFTLF